MCHGQTDSGNSEGTGMICELELELEIVYHVEVLESRLFGLKCHAVRKNEIGTAFVADLIRIQE